MVATNRGTVSLGSVKALFNVGKTKFYDAKAVQGVLGLNTVVAVILAARTAGIEQRERDGKTRWLFTENEIQRLAVRPRRGRPVGTGHPNGPHKATLAQTSSDSVESQDILPVMNVGGDVVDMPNLDLPIDSPFI